MPTITIADGRLEVRHQHEVLRVEPWGDDSARVRVGRHTILEDLPGALLDAKPTAAVITEEGRGARLVNGLLTVDLLVTGIDGGTDVSLRFTRTDTGEELLAEQRAHFWWPGARMFAEPSNGTGRLEQRFAAYEGEKIFGLGQHQHGKLDQAEMVLDLVQRNSEITIPFALSSRGYGFLWNSPAVGRVEFARNGTRWVADAARQIDYWVTTGPDPRAILSHYADATGHAPVLPEWATGFWQSKLRYRSQDELMEVAREYQRRGLPLSVIVVDYFAWTHLGDWKFDPAEWPDPAAAIAELAGMGVKLMVSVWPSVNPQSENYNELVDKGYLIATERGVPYHAPWTDKGFDVPMPVAFYDATNPDARQFVWDKVEQNYLSLGADVWWLDACEPEIKPGDPGNLDFHAGSGHEVFNLYPREHARGFYDGMHAAGRDDVVLLCRSAWAGSQRYGAAVWSGDIDVTFASLGAQVRAGLNMAVSGIPWWTTDIGGFHGGDPSDPAYQELVVRWFQYSAFCPLFRLHGFREPRTTLGASQTGGPNEVWSYGEEAYAHITATMALREKLRPYLDEQMRATAEHGVAPMRPLFVDFADDPSAWDVEDQFLLGPDVLVAPVLEAGATTRSVYLPAGARWLTADGTGHDGGRTVEVAAPIDVVPFFVREGASESALVLLGG